jgi:alpha-mannosidase
MELRSAHRSVAGLALLVALLASGAPRAAQSSNPSPALRIPTQWLQGFVKPLAGEVLVYPWAYPGQVKTLLSRATTGRMAVSWAGEPVPPGRPDDPVTYLWHAGTAAGYGAHAFTFFLNGRAVATFRSGRSVEDREWSVTGENGLRLSFVTTRVGAFRELFGFMWATAPRSVFGSGTPTFGVTGEAASSDDYYLGPAETVRAFTRVYPEEAVDATGQRLIRVEFSHVGNAAPARIEVGTRSTTIEIRPGFGSAIVQAGPNAAGSAVVTVAVDGSTRHTETVPLKEVEKRTLHVLAHSHVDIGYSDPQPEVERKQWKNLRDAIALGGRTSSYPPEARFRWNVEGLWAVESYLQQASATERQAFADAVRVGTIGLQANYANLLTGLATPEELRHWTDAARRLSATYGFGVVRSAMQSDVPGLNWSVVAALAQGGVRYLSSGPNYMPGTPDGGDRIGGTLKALGDRPFWWTSPSGEERVLFWMAGRGYSWFHGLNAGGLSEAGRDSLLDYVRSLVETGYPFDMIQVRYTVGGDNGPIDPSLPDAVKTWNERYLTPRLVIDTSESMFAEFEQKYGASLPAFTGDMTPYWEDGALSTAAEEALTRRAVRRLAQAETLWALRNPRLFPAAEASDAWRSVLLWHEHTWGAADSVRQPDRPDVVAQWEYKRTFATEADRRSRALLAGASAAPGSAVDVVNTLSWARSGLVFLPADASREGDRVRTSEGRTLLSQRLSDGRLAVWMESVPPLGAVRLRVERGSASSPKEPVRVDGGTIDNGVFRFVVDPGTGGITNLGWKATGTRQVMMGGNEPPRTVPQPGRPTPPVIGFTYRGAPRARFTQLEAGSLGRYVYVPGRDPSAPLTSAIGRLSVVESGPLVAVVRTESDASGTSGLRHTYQIAAGSDEIELTVELEKTAVRTKESAHLAFPFLVPDAVFRTTLGEATLQAGHQQFPGSCREFFGVSSAADVSGPEYGVSLASLDAPLVEPGALTDEREGERGARAWRENVAPGATLYSYLLNNYWHTNYKADQSGPLRFRYALWAHGAFDPAALHRFSAEQDQPLLALPVDPATPLQAAPFTIEGGAVVVSALRPSDDGRSLLVRVFNPGATAATVSLKLKAGASRAVLVDAAGGAARPVTGSVPLPPRATRLLQIDLR